MLLRTQLVRAGESELLPGEFVDRYSLQEINEQLLAEDKETAAGVPMLLGITKASLATDSFLSASSFQHTIRVLAGAAIAIGFVPNLGSAAKVGKTNTLVPDPPEVVVIPTIPSFAANMA